MRRNIKRFAALVMALCFAFGACGCMGKVIAEDKTKLNLPQIDPDDGASRELPVTLYYRLTNEEYLAGVDGVVSVRSGERIEAAVIRALMEGSSVIPGVTALIHSSVSLKELTYEEGVLYVTLSEEFLNEDMVTSIREEDYLKEKDYNSAVREATKEMYLTRRLGVHSIINTIAGSGQNVKVQVLVERGGKGEPVTPAQLGLEEGNVLFAEPSGYDGSVIANEERIAACMLERMVKGEYEMAYTLITSGMDIQKPTYADFETSMRGLGVVVSYEITGSGSDGSGRYVIANVRISSPTGTVKRVSNAVLYMMKENDIYKVSYGSLKKLMES